MPIFKRGLETSSSDETCSSSSTGLLGEGDQGLPSPRIKTFCNGVRVPVFEAESCPAPSSEDACPTESSSVHFPGIDCEEVQELMDELFTCPVCMDYLIEVCY